MDIVKEKKKTSPKTRFYRKRAKLFNLVNKIKLWPSRSGRLHGVKSIVILGDEAKLTTHCQKEFFISNSLNSRAARWLRNKWYTGVCSECSVPTWKIEKYSSTFFRRHQGSLLTMDKD